VPLHKREAYFLWYALRSRSDEHATNLKRKLEKNGVLRMRCTSATRSSYLLSLVSQTIEAAETQTHKF